MKAPPISEKDWQATVTDLAAALGWRRAHFRAAQTARGNHMTPVAYEGKGFPDLVLVRERIVFAELKGSRGVLRPEQREWLQDLAAAGVEAYCWAPKHIDEVESVLRRVEGIGS